VIHADASPERLAIARIAVFGVWFVSIVRTPMGRFPAVPEVFIEPPAILSFLPATTLLTNHAAVLTLQITGLLFCLLCVFGARPWRPIALTAVVLILWHDGALKSIQGYVNHAQLVPLFAAFLLAFSPAADAFSLGRPRRLRSGTWTYGGPLVALAFIMALTYTFIGIRRLVHGAWGVFTDGTILTSVLGRTLQYAPYESAMGDQIVQWPGASVLLPLGMLVVTVFESLSPLALRHGRFRVSWLVVVITFHITTLFLMNIFFWESLILLPAFFAENCDGLRERVRSFPR
jgi:hypothetical protein